MRLLPAVLVATSATSRAPAGSPEVIFEPPVLIGPASTPNGTVCSCDFAKPPPGSPKGLKDVCSKLPGIPHVPIETYSSCDGGAPYFYGLGGGRLFGSMGGDKVNMGYYTSTDSARSWQHPVTPLLPATALGSSYKKDTPASFFLLPSGPGRLHSSGPGLTLAGGLPSGSLTAPNCTEFTMEDGKLRWTPLEKPITFRGAPVKL